MWHNALMLSKNHKHFSFLCKHSKPIKQTNNRKYSCSPVKFVSLVRKSQRKCPLDLEFLLGQFMNVSPTASDNNNNNKRVSSSPLIWLVISVSGVLIFHDLICASLRKRQQSPVNTACFPRNTAFRSNVKAHPTKTWRKKDRQIWTRSTFNRNVQLDTLWLAVASRWLARICPNTWLFIPPTKFTFKWSATPRDSQTLKLTYWIEHRLTETSV